MKITVKKLREAVKLLEPYRIREDSSILLPPGLMETMETLAEDLSPRSDSDLHPSGNHVGEVKNATGGF